MESKKKIQRLFQIEVDDGGAYKYCKKKKSYMKYKKKFNMYETKIIKLADSRLSENEYKKFEIMLEELKGAIYDMEFEEKEYYFREGCKIGIQIVGDLFK